MVPQRVGGLAGGEIESGPFYGRCRLTLLLEDIHTMFASIRAETWENATDISALLIRWGFRGHANSAWALESTLLRLAHQCQCESYLLNHREYWMLRQFERRAFDYLDGVPLPSTKLDWLSLIQHYGGPTRLLDFSHSFYVAAFFAMESAEADAAVWAVNLDVLECRIAQVMGVSKDEENIDRINTRYAKYVEAFLGLESPPKQAQRLVVPVEPDRLHRRLTGR